MKRTLSDETEPVIKHARLSISSLLSSIETEQDNKSNRLKINSSNNKFFLLRLCLFFFNSLVKIMKLHMKISMIQLLLFRILSPIMIMMKMKMKILM